MNRCESQASPLEKSVLGLHFCDFPINYRPLGNSTYNSFDYEFRSMHVYSISLLLFLRKPESEGDRRVAERDESELDFAGIRCPLCGWRPVRSSRWVCAELGPPEKFDGGCGTSWNTFETKGLCPCCSHQWIWTTCLDCMRISPHEEWYESPSPRS
jgi:hypothetical protein